MTTMTTMTGQAEFDEIVKAVAELIKLYDEHKRSVSNFMTSPYHELKWVQHYPASYGAECALMRIKKLLKKNERHKIIISLDDDMARKLVRLWNG